MGDISLPVTPPGDRAAECHTRAAADRDEGGAMMSPPPSGGDPGASAAGAAPARPAPVGQAMPTSLQVLGQAGLTAIIALPVMIFTYKWFAG